MSLGIAGGPQAIEPAARILEPPPLGSGAPKEPILKGGRDAVQEDCATSRPEMEDDLGLEVTGSRLLSNVRAGRAAAPGRPLAAGQATYAQGGQRRRARHSAEPAMKVIELHNGDPVAEQGPGPALGAFRSASGQSPLANDWVRDRRDSGSRVAR